MLKRTITLFLVFPLTNSNFECSDGSVKIAPKYYLIEKCQRSTLSVLAFANYASLSGCQRFGIEKKGLALNFSPPGQNFSDGGDLEVPEYNCEILKCAESEIGLSLVNDTRYDYYTLFARPMPDVNTTCVPGIGMIKLIKQKLNYSQSIEVCNNRSGHLADVVSETRTDSLAQVLASSDVESAYIGMIGDNSSTFRTVTGDFLDCNSYRAWAPGHPRRRRRTVYGCVVITRARTWKTVACGTRLPSLCELISQGPYVIGSIETAKMLNETSRK